jgi:predicted Zn-ribbon and HTH transcriptional regulator
MYKYLLVLCLTINVSYASAVKLVDYLVSGSGIAEILAKQGIKGEDAKQVQSYVASSLMALGNKSTLTKDELYKVLSALPVTGRDADVRKSLQMILDTDANKIQKKDVVSAINNIIYLANRHGKSVIITCAECVNDSLAKQGFKFTVENVKNASATKLLNDVIPKNPAQLNTFISGRMKRLGMGDYSKVTPDLVAPEDEKSLALFLGLAESGSTDQKALIASIKKLSTRNGKVNIIDPKNPHKFWKVLADDMSPQDMAGWTKTLDEVGARANKDGITSEEAFYRTLKDKAQGNDYLTKQYETLKTKRCFFK